jgi:hypothetical protein
MVIIHLLSKIGHEITVTKSSRNTDASSIKLLVMKGVINANKNIATWTVAIL